MPEDCAIALLGKRVAVVGGGLGGLMAARTLGKQGVKVTVYEARAQVGGRVLSDSTFAPGRIVEAGAELIGSIHTRWCALAKEYGLGLVSRMNTDLYVGQQLDVKLTLDRPLTNKQIRAIEERRSKLVLRPIAEHASKIVDPTQPWNDRKDLHVFDRISVASYLKNYLRVGPDGPTAQLWQATRHLLENNNVAKLEDMNMLGLLCLVKGGQQGTIDRDPLMGYWNELEIYRCANGAQRLAIAIAHEVQSAKGCRVVPNLAVTRIALPTMKGAPVLVTARSTRSREIDRRLDDLTPPTGIPYDAVVFAVPPSVWDLVQITPTHPKDVVGVMTMGGAAKFFSRFDRRFWISASAAPSGGSLDLGHIWEGTENQTILPGQYAVLSVFAGGPARPRTEPTYRARLTDLFPDYAAARPRTLLADWTTQPFIMAGYTAPGLGQILTVGRLLHEPFRDRLVFAGDHTQLDHFGYMEGAIRSGERAARQVVDLICGRPQADVRVAGVPVRVVSPAANKSRV